MGGPGRSNSALTFLSLTSPSWMPATLTQPPASGSCSGAQRTRRLNPASTAPMTPSSSRYVLRASRLSLLLKGSPCTRVSLHHLFCICSCEEVPSPHSSWDPASHLGSAVDLGWFSPARPACYHLCTGRAGKSCSCYAPAVRKEPPKPRDFPSVYCLTDFSSLPCEAGTMMSPFYR